MLVSHIDEFEKMQARLMGIAYRMLGSWSEAEDAVQDVYVTWCEQLDHSKIANSGAWLAKVCTNRCLDKLKSAHHKRMNYIGLWLPEPLQTNVADAPEDLIDHKASLDFAFLTVLDRLGPKERAAYLLREVFDYSYDEVADFLNLSPANSRQIVSRARKSIQSNHKPAVEAGTLQRALLDAFREAVSTGDTREFAAKLSHAVELWADGGGKVVAAQETVQGIEAVAHLIEKGLFHAWKKYVLKKVQINYAPGLVLMDADTVVGCVTCDIDSSQGGVRIFVVRNPDKLRQLNGTTRVSALDGQLVAVDDVA